MNKFDARAVVGNRPRITMDAETKHDPSTGQFTGEGGSSGGEKYHPEHGELHQVHASRADAENHVRTLKSKGFERASTHETKGGHAVYSGEHPDPDDENLTISKEGLYDLGYEDEDK